MPQYIEPHQTGENMQAYQVQTAVANDGSIKLHNLPFPAGEAVEVIILTRAPALPRPNQYPLRGTPIKYLDPTEPVADTDWEAAQ
jgi:hypothetical protein